MRLEEITEAFYVPDIAAFSSTLSMHHLYENTIKQTSGQ
jgi:hypothetical protein